MIFKMPVIKERGKEMKEKLENASRILETFSGAYLSINEIAELFGTNISRVRSLINLRKKIKGFRLPTDRKRVFVLKKDIKNLINELMIKNTNSLDKRIPSGYNTSA